jgi:hypothetical protein
MHDNTLAIESLMELDSERQRAANSSVADERGALPAWLEVVWLLVLPITSVLVVPGLQGSTPAVLCAACAALQLLLVRSPRTDRALYRLALFAVGFALLQCASSFAAEQLPLGMEPLLTFTNWRRLDESFLPTVATQSAYLAVGAVTAMYAAEFLGRRSSRWIFCGALALVAYGFYEWLYFLQFQESGDFLSNRTFSDEQAFDPDAFSGSLVQTIEAFGFSLLRLKSLTGEPSMFAMATLPYFFLALCTARRWTALCLLGGLLLSAASTALVALPVGLVLWLAFRPGAWRLTQRGLMIALMIAAAAVVLLSTGLPQSLMENVWTELRDKLQGRGDSGQARLDSHAQSVEFFLSAPLPIQLVGLGFGATRPLAFIDWLLINCGLIGTVAWLALFLWPVWRLPSTNTTNVGLKVALTVTLLAMLVGVPEFSYPTTWLFLGLAYARLPGGNDES